MNVLRLCLLFGSAVVAVALPLPGDRAAASCAAPYLRIAGTPRELRPPVRRGSTVTVTGFGFVDGCDDSRGTTTFGCFSHSEEREPEHPLPHLSLRVRQQGRAWALGTADAEKAAHQRLGRVTWEVRLPAALRPGRATLGADGSQPLVVLVRR